MISDNYVPLNQLGNGITTVFSASWNMLAASYIRVYFEDTTTGVQTPQLTGWSLVFNDSGFSVTFSVAPPSTVRVIIGRVVALVQSTPFRTSRGWQGNTVENAFDKIVGMVQDIVEQVDRALVFPLGDTASPVLQSAALRANKTFIFDSAGNASAGSVTGTTVSASMIPVVNAASTAAALALLGGMLSSVYDPANIAQQIIGTTASQALTNKSVNGVTLTTGGSAMQFLNGAGSYAEPSNPIKAWVNFSGTGTVAIRASFNVSSITDNGTGDYTVNFTSSLADANYAVMGTCGDQSVASSPRAVMVNSATAPTASACRICTTVTGTGAEDQSRVSVSFLR